MITLSFAYGTNLDNRDRLDLVKQALPAGVGSPVIFQMDPTAMPILRIALRGDRDTNELRVIAEDLIQAQFEQVDGVASISVMGGRPPS
jgi:HAE1 family hydrophobic/amphiphilic exporter-1